MSFQDLLLVTSGALAGAIDSIAGGGGLITLPVLSEVLEPGAHAIGTNKIIGTAGALIAFIVYFRHLRSKGEAFPLRKGAVFLVSIALGSLLGSICNPHLDKIYFRYLLIAACPLLLWVLWNKQLFVAAASLHGRRPLPVLIATGVSVGFYDGFFGPGGGTLMLLGLLWAARMPLFEALLLSKLANTLSAGTSLVSYGIQGYVHVIPGLTMAVGVVVGGYCGARMATQQAEKIVRPVLAAVVILLMLVQIRELIH